MNIQLQNIGNTPPAAAAKKTQASESAGNAKPLKTEAQTSEASLQITELKASIDASPGIDMDKVKQISDAIKSGSYHIDPKKIAENMVRLEQLLH